MRYMVRAYIRGRLHYLTAESYQTALLAAQAIYDARGDDVEIWQGVTILWRNGCPTSLVTKAETGR